MERLRDAFALVTNRRGRWLVDIGGIVVGSYELLREAVWVAYDFNNYFDAESVSVKLDGAEARARLVVARARQAAIDREAEINREARRLAQRIEATR